MDLNGEPLEPGDEWIGADFDQPGNRGAALLQVTDVLDSGWFISTTSLSTRGLGRSRSRRA